MLSLPILLLNFVFTPKNMYICISTYHSNDPKSHLTLVWLDFFPFRIHCKTIYCIYIQRQSDFSWLKTMQNILKCDCLLFQYIHTVIFLPKFLIISATVFLRTLNECFRNLWEKIGNQDSTHSSITFGQLLLKDVLSHFL